jgi:hypothetical protein
LENLPSQSAQGVATVNGNDRKNQKIGIRVANGVEKLLSAKTPEVDDPPRKVDDQPENEEPEQNYEQLPRP